MATRIARKRGDVFLRADFSDLGGYNQVGRALRDLVRKGYLIRIGLGLYARASLSSFDGKPLPVKGLSTLREAIQRLGAEVVPTRFELAYNSGQSDQVPTGRVVAIRGKRIRRQIGYDGFVLMFERATAPRRGRQPPKANRRAVKATAAPITVREALRPIWEADRYPIRSNEDRRHAVALEEEARDHAAPAVASPDDLPEFVGWLNELMDRKLPDDRRDAIMEALYTLFDPSGSDEETVSISYMA